MHLFLFLIDLYFLISAAVAQIFDPIAELITFIEIPSKEAKAKIKMNSLVAKLK